MNGTWTALRAGTWLSPRRVRLACGFMAALTLACWTYFLGGPGHLDPSGRPVGADFSAFYAVSRALLDGTPAASLYTPETFNALARPFTNGRTYVWVYPPIALLPYWPLGFLPYLAALAAWLALGVGAYLAAVRAVLPGREALAVAAAFPAVLMTALHGHNGFVIAAAIGGGLALLPSRPVAAGLLLGLAAVKPHLALLVPLALVAGRRWRALAAAGASALALALASTAAFGLEAWQAFHHAAPIARDMLEAQRVAYWKIASAFSWVRLLGGGVTLAYAVQLAAAVLAAGIVVYLWSTRRPYEVQAAALVFGSLAATPYVYDYDLVVVGVGIAFLARLAMREGWLPWEKTALAAAWIAPLLARPVARAVPIQVVPLVLACGLVLVLRRAAGAPRRSTDTVVAPIAAARG